MEEEEIEKLKEINEIKNSNPIIDFIYTPIVDSFYINNKLIFIEY